MSIFNVYASLMVSNNIQNQIFKIQKKNPKPNCNTKIYSFSSNISAKISKIAN